MVIHSQKAFGIHVICYHETLITKWLHLEKRFAMVHQGLPQKSEVAWHGCGLWSINHKPHLCPAHFD